MTLYGGLETGGTTWCGVVGTGPDDVRDSIEFPIGQPDPTIAKAIAFFARHQLAAVGVGSFGPVDRDRSSARWGRVTSTPKPGWGGVDITGPIGTALSIPIAFETDVSAAALGEHRWGAAQDVQSFCYVTVGTGIGGGVIVDGVLHNGAMHPEIGHMAVLRDVQLDDFAGVCPFHGDCWEGLASATSMKARWGRSPLELPDDHVAWEIEAEYLARGIMNLIYILSPERVILGGGVMHRAGLMDRVRAKLPGLVNGYIPFAEGDALNTFLSAPGLADRSGSLGALALAQSVHSKSG